MTSRREKCLTFWSVGQRKKTAAQSRHHQLNADACHCSRFWLRAESLRYQSAHACTSFPLVEADIKMLTRSMRFPHDPPAGNSRRGEVDDGEAENGARKSVFKAHISFDSDAAREERAVRRLRHERNSICCDSPHDVVDENAGARRRLIFVVCGGGRKKKEPPLISSSVWTNWYF